MYIMCASVLRVFTKFCKRLRFSYNVQPVTAVTAGDTGDNFYLIDEGTFDVYINKAGVETKVMVTEVICLCLA